MEMAADIGNLVYVIASRLSGITGDISFPFVSPAVAAARSEASRRSSEAVRKIEETEWEEV